MGGNIIISIIIVSINIMNEIMIRRLFRVFRTCWQLGGHSLGEVVSMFSWGTGTWEGGDETGLCGGLSCDLAGLAQCTRRVQSRGLDFSLSLTFFLAFAFLIGVVFGLVMRFSWLGGFANLS